MRVVYLLPFLHAEPRLLPSFARDSLPSDPGLGSVDLRLDRVGQFGASSFTNVAARRTVTVGPFEGTFLIGKLGLSLLAVDTDVDGLDCVSVTERAVLDAASPLLASLAVESRSVTGTADTGAISVLWVHRILVNTGLVGEVASLAYGETCVLSRGARCVVADGFSAVEDAGEDHVAAAVLGLFAATEAWVGYDWLSRESVALLVDASSGTIPTGRDVTASEPAAVAFQARALTAYLRRLHQGLVDGNEAIYTTAVRTWGLDSELASLVDRSDAYVEYLQAQLSERRSRVDRRRNLLLFGLSFTALAQTIAAAFELLAGESADLGPSLRLMVALLVAALMIGGLLVGLVFAMVDARKDSESSRAATEGPRHDLH